MSSWWGFLSPGAPGFPYVFKMPGAPLSAPPLILLSGDCTGSAYIFAPRNVVASDANVDTTASTTTAVDDDGSPGPSPGSVISPGPGGVSSSVPPYEMVFEIQCGATVGSAAVAAALDGSVGHNTISLTHSLTHSPTHALTHSLTHSLTQIFTHSVLAHLLTPPSQDSPNPSFHNIPSHLTTHLTSPHLTSPHH